MKLTILMHGATIGGGELYVERVVNELKKHFSEIVIYSWHQEIPHLGKVFVACKNEYRRFRTVDYFSLYFDLIRGKTHLWLTSGIRDLPILFLLLLINRKNNGLLYIQSKPSLKTNFLSKILQKAYFRCIVTLVNAQKINISFSSKSLSKYYFNDGIKQEKLTIISPLLNIFLNKADLNYDRPEETHLNLLVVSRLYDPTGSDDQKGIQYIFEVVKLLSNEFKTITLFWRGAGDPQVIENYLGTVKNVRVDLQFVERFWLNIPSDAIFFAPSKSEGYGLGYLECQLLGFSCVVSSIFDENVEVSKKILKAKTFDPNEFLVLILKARRENFYCDIVDTSKIECTISPEKNANKLFNTIVGE